MIGRREFFRFLAAAPVGAAAAIASARAAPAATISAEKMRAAIKQMLDAQASFPRYFDYVPVVDHGHPRMITDPGHSHGIWDCYGRQVAVGRYA